MHYADPKLKLLVLCASIHVCTVYLRQCMIGYIRSAIIPESIVQ